MTSIQPRRFATRAAFEQALIERLDRAIGAPEPGWTALMLSGGRTPLPVYHELARRGPRPAAGLRLLYSDDRYVPSTSESSNYFQSRPLVEALGLPEGAVLRVRTELALEAAATDYEQQLAALLRSGVHIGLGLLGLGADGHTASLFSATDLEEAHGRLAIAVQRPDGLQGISVTPELFSGIGELLFLVAGADKHAIVEGFLRRDSNLIARRAVSGCPNVQIWIAP
ncbi:MAG TPA: 6-phosphogluconolactonase [Steroidobacteraceae bacterium]|jgi:6-phosphogluconolactonase/glucosamine-6-phosphate isomerase/deaminase